MKVKYKYIDRKKAARLTKEFYEVLGFGYHNGKVRPILIINDDLKFNIMDEDAVQIIDENKEGYIQADELAYNTEFYIKKELYPYCKEFESYSDLQHQGIWNQSKIVNFFIQNGYEIPENIQKTVLNQDYKLNLIQGYLDAINNYLTIKNKSGFWETIYFEKRNSLSEHIEERFKDDLKIEKLQKEDYLKILQKFMERTIYLKESGKDDSLKIISGLIKLIDSIFINPITSITNVITFYDDEIVIEYESNYYSIFKTWGS